MLEDVSYSLQVYSSSETNHLQYMKCTAVHATTITIMGTDTYRKNGEPFSRQIQYLPHIRIDNFYQFLDVIFSSGLEVKELY